LRHSFCLIEGADPNKNQRKMIRVSTFLLGDEYANDVELIYKKIKTINKNKC